MIDIDAPGAGFFVSVRKFLVIALILSVVSGMFDEKSQAGAAISSRLGMSNTIRQAEERYIAFNRGQVKLVCYFISVICNDWSSTNMFDKIHFYERFSNFQCIILATVTSALMTWWALTRRKRNLKRLFCIWKTVPGSLDWVVNCQKEFYWLVNQAQVSEWHDNYSRCLRLYVCMYVCVCAQYFMSTRKLNRQQHRM